MIQSAPLKTKQTIHIIPIEPIETRYTSQWYSFIPKILSQYSNVIIYDGEISSNNTTPGAFLDFLGTNQYKSSQLIGIAEAFNNISDGDIFLYTDAWNPTVIQLKYMASLLKKNIKIYGILHAGAYDPNDFLGREIGQTRWMDHSEAGILNCYDKLFVATEYHKSLVNRTHHLRNIHVCGFPFDYLEDLLLNNKPKSQQIVFPHRLSVEKQPHIFDELAKELPYSFIKCQENVLTKSQYHSIMAESKLCVSFSLQETLGIGCAEAIYSGSLVLCPNHLSYSEIYIDEFKYPSCCILDFKTHKKYLMERIVEMMNMDEHTHKMLINEQRRRLGKYFTSENLIKEIVGND